MKLKLTFLATLVMIAGLLTTAPAQAGCRDYPESITPGCVAQNLAEEQARQLETQARMAQELIDAQRRAELAAQEQWVAQGSRTCALYPESVTPACIAENLAYEKERQALEAKRWEQIALDAKKAEEENNYRVWMADGGRACALYPASITPECVAENLVHEQKRQEAYAAKQAQALIDAQALAEYQQKRQMEAAGGRICALWPEAGTAGCIAETKAYNENLVRTLGADVAKAQIAEQKAALAKAKEDYIQSGRRECTVYPASLKPECIEENTAYASETADQIAALAAKKAENEKAKVVVVRDGEDVLVDLDLPKAVDPLKAVVRLLSSKKKVVDTAEIRFDTADDPYLVFDEFTKSGKFTLQYQVGKKKSAGKSLTVPKVETVQQ